MEEPLGGQDGLQGGEEGTPPGQDEHLLVGPDGQDGLVGDKVRIEDRDDPGLNSREHAGVDVVGADAGRFDVPGVAPVGHLHPDGDEINFIVISCFKISLISLQCKPLNVITLRKARTVLLYTICSHPILRLFLGNENFKTSKIKIGFF